MITQADIYPLLLSYCPSFRIVFEASEDKDIPYAIAGEFSDHLLTLHYQGTTQVFGDVAKLLERMLTEGDEYVQALATNGIVEGIQNSWVHNGVNPEIFGKCLLPNARRDWEALNQAWRDKENT